MTMMVKVLDLIKYAHDSVDFGDVDIDDNNAHTGWWQEIIRVKSADTGFGALVNAILQNGFDPESPVGWDPEDGTITEGHHRIVAAILLCLDEIPYSRYGGGDRSICAHDCNCNGESYNEPGGLLGVLEIE